MYTRKNICIGIIVSFLLFSLIFSLYKSAVGNTKTDRRYIQHEVELEKGADPSLGIDFFEDDKYEVDESFTTHLPIVVFDYYDTEPEEAYHFDNEKKIFVKIDGAEPYVSAKINIIDNENSINRLGDVPSLSSDMRVKYRGNSSLRYDKHQYRINLVDKDGNDNPLNIMGMGEECDWILNISMIDMSYLRNYMTYNIAGQFVDYVPDVRLCELIVKAGDEYRYDGLYMMNEVIEQGKDRVDISKTKKKNNYTSYLVRRDRYDEEDIMLPTYATLNGLSYGWMALRYPKNDKATPEMIDYVTEDISSIEKILYSDDEETFLQYPEFIDVGSFVDYFIINEVLTNYDAGNNSTYMYRQFGEKLKIGPLWDYDNCLDNMHSYLLDPEYIAFSGQPWFDRLVNDERFCDRLIRRYSELRKSYFSEEYMMAFIKQADSYLGNAAKRDWSRWHRSYENYRFDLLKDINGITVNRNIYTHEAQTQRMTDTLNEHAKYLMKNLYELKSVSMYKAEYRDYKVLGIVFVIAVLTSIVAVRRKRNI